jgi:hypothetical protein
MENNHTAIEIQLDSHLESDKCNAYHQAGHAAAIHFGNWQQQLPPVHFEISIKPQGQDEGHPVQLKRSPGNNIVKIEGGRLIQSLPMSLAETTQSFSWYQSAQFRSAFEADVINLLAGPLAEAKYVALCDGEIFNANLVNLRALIFYGGDQDMSAINDYMECFVPGKADRRQKLADLFSAAYCLINKRAHWPAIATLAEFILDQPIGTILCEDVISLLDTGVTFEQAKQLGLRKTEIRDFAGQGKSHAIAHS